MGRGESMYSPKPPWAICSTQRTYCTGTGSSRPRVWRTRSICSWVMLGTWRRSASGSPVSVIAPKMMNVAAIRMGIEMRKRRSA
jgi:hypothetical protein